MAHPNATDADRAKWSDALLQQWLRINIEPSEHAAARYAILQARTEWPTLEQHVPWGVLYDAGVSLRRRRAGAGFTLIELMIVVAIIGILAAIALPNFFAMRERALEGSTKANMHTMQLAAEDFAVEHDGAYAEMATQVAGGAQQLGINGPMMWTGDVRCDFPNPFTGERGNGRAYENRDAYADAPSEIPGIVSYVGQDLGYNIKGFGAHQALPLVIESGEHQVAEGGNQ